MKTLSTFLTGSLLTVAPFAETVNISFNNNNDNSYSTRRIAMSEEVFN